MQTSDGIMMIEPSKTSDTPLVDELTRKMTAAWRCRRDGDRVYRGFHICVCGVHSDNSDHWVGTGEGLLTNSLCVHYLAFHRADIPMNELEKVLALPYGEQEPNQRELAQPKRNNR